MNYPGRLSWGLNSAVPRNRSIELVGKKFKKSLLLGIDKEMIAGQQMKNRLRGSLFAPAHQTGELRDLIL